MKAALKILFFIILVLFSFGEIIRLNFGNGIFLKPLDICVGFTSALWLTSKIIGKSKVKQKYIYIPILFFAGFGFLSLLINYSDLNINQFVISLMYLIRWIVYAGMFFVVLDFDKNYKKLISKLLIIFGSIIVVLGYVQYFYYSNLRNLFYLGWDEHMYRMFSIFLDPNFAGVFFVLFFLFTIDIFLKKKSLAIGFLTFLTLGAVFLTFSRSALIMLVISSGVLFVLQKKKIWILLLMLIALVVLSASSRYFNIENINLFRVVSSQARLETAKNAVSIISENPLIGVGFNSYRYAQFRYGFRNESSVMSHADASPDNSFLFVLATTGIIGFVLYLFFWFRLIKITSILASASVVGVFVSSMFINSLFYSFIMLWLWIILALSIKNHN